MVPRDSARAGELAEGVARALEAPPIFDKLGEAMFERITSRHRIDLIIVSIIKFRSKKTTLFVDSFSFDIQRASVTLRIIRRWRRGSLLSLDSLASLPYVPR